MTTSLEFKQRYALSDKAFREVRKAILEANPDLTPSNLMARQGRTEWRLERLELWEGEIVKRGIKPAIAANSGAIATITADIASKPNLSRWTQPVDVPDAAIRVESYDPNLGSWLAHTNAETIVDLAKSADRIVEISMATEAVQNERRRLELEEQRIKAQEWEERKAYVRLQAEYEMLEEERIKAEVRGKPFNAQARLDELARALGR